MASISSPKTVPQCPAMTTRPSFHLNLGKLIALKRSLDLFSFRWFSVELSVALNETHNESTSYRTHTEGTELRVICSLKYTFAAIISWMFVVLTARDFTRRVLSFHGVLVFQQFRTALIVTSVTFVMNFTASIKKNLSVFMMILFGYLNPRFWAQVWQDL